MFGPPVGRLGCRLAHGSDLSVLVLTVLYVQSHFRDGLVHKSRLSDSFLARVFSMSYPARKI
jgi:hypothetical protein